MLYNIIIITYILQKINSLLNLPFILSKGYKYPVLFNSTKTNSGILFLSEYQVLFNYLTGEIKGQSTSLKFDETIQIRSSGSLTIYASSLYIYENNGEQFIRYNIFDNQDQINYLQLFINNQNDFYLVSSYDNNNCTKITRTLLPSNLVTITKTNMTICNNLYMSKCVQIYSIDGKKYMSCFFICIKTIRGYLIASSNWTKYSNYLYYPNLDNSIGIHTYSFKYFINIICSLKENYEIECMNFELDTNVKKFFDKNKFTILNNCSPKNNDFILNEFSYGKIELLGCCASGNKIKCQRIDKDYNVNGNIISIESGINNYYVRMIQISSKALEIIYHSSNDDATYAYLIYIPKCKSFSFELVIKKINEIKFENFVEFITSNEQYIKFENYTSTSYGKIYYGNSDNEVNNDNKYNINPEYFKFYFESTSMSSTSLIFAFNIITNETYSTINQCELTIKINSCYIGCYLCYNIESDTSHNCESCKEDYYKSPENENDCYKISEKKDNWFYDTNTNSIKLCYDKCKSCSDFYDENTDNMNCIECIDNYYFKEGTNNCYDINYMNNGYYLNEDNKFSPCNYHCKTCYGRGTNDIQKCNLCTDNLYKIYNDENNNCYDNTIVSQGYYLKDNIYYKCDIFCKTCDITSKNCTSCIDNFSLLNNSCYNSCNKKTKFYYDGECYKNCPVYTYLYKSKFYCLNECPSNSIANDVKKICEVQLDTSVNPEKLIDQINEQILDFAFPDSLIKNNNYTIQVYELNDSESIKQLAYENQLSYIELNECANYLKQYYNISDDEDLIMLKADLNMSQSSVNKIAYFIYDYKGNELNVSLCNEIKINVYTPITNSELINWDLAVELSKQGINIFDPNSDFFNDICSTFSSDSNSDVTLSDRRKDYYQDVNFCNEGCESSDINFNNKSVNCICTAGLHNENDEINLDNPKTNLKDLGNVFKNSLHNSNIVVAKCFKLVFNGKLILVNVGFWIMICLIVIQIILLIFFCRKGLKPIKNLMIISKPNFNKKNESNPPKKNIKNNNLYFDEKNIDSNEESENEISFEKNRPTTYNSMLNSNQNFYTYSKSSNTLNSIHEDNNNDKENNNIDKENNNIDNENNNNVNKNNNDNVIKKIRLSNFYNNNPHFINYFQKINLSKNDILKINTINNNTSHKKTFSGSSISKLSQKSNFDFHTLSSSNISDEEKPKKKTNNQYTNEDLFDLDYEESLLYDSRSFCQLYWNYLQIQQVIINTFIFENFFELRIIKIFFWIFTIGLEFTLNALFYSDKYISHTYHNNGVVDFVSNIPKSIYSFLVTVLITYFLVHLSNSKSKLKSILTKSKSIKEYNINCKKELKCLKIKLIFFFSIDFILYIFFWYYSSAFCAVYHNSQFFWVYGSLESITIGLILPFFLCLIVAFLRYIALKKQCKILFKINNFLYMFI